MILQKTKNHLKEDSYKDLNTSPMSHVVLPTMSVPSDEKKEHSETSLGNRELDKRTTSIYYKYYRKQIAQFALTVGNVGKLKTYKNHGKTKLKKSEIKGNLSFRDTLKTVNKSLCSCGRDPHFMNDSGDVELKKSNEGTKRLKGLKSCGNNASCPVCASKLSFIRGGDLKEFINVGKANGRSYAMIVTTIPHKPLEALEITLNQVIEMSSYIFNSRKWKEFRKVTQCRFVHGGLENMVSFKNGQIDWHPHKNYLLDFDITLPEVFKLLGLKTDLDFRLYLSKMLTDLGQRFLDNKSIGKTLLPAHLKQRANGLMDIKGGVTVSTHFDDKYITKWGLDAEMTAGVYKEGRFEGASFHPFGLLDMIDEKNTEIGDKQRYQAVMAFQEFVVASKGKRWFYFGRGAVDYYNDNYGSKIKVKSDEQALESLEDEGDKLWTFDSYEWVNFKATPKKIYEAFIKRTDDETIQYFIDEIERNMKEREGTNNVIEVLDNGMVIEYEEIIYIE